MKRFWDDAASIFETASAACQEEASEIAILIDQQNGLRILDASGWQLDALRREYQADTAYTVKRMAGSVIVEAQNDSSQCTLKKINHRQAIATLTSGMPQHLIRPDRMLSA